MANPELTEALRIRCRTCRQDFVIVMDPSDYIAWIGGAPAQEVLPYLTKAELQLLVLNSCGTCFVETVT